MKVLRYILSKLHDDTICLSLGKGGYVIDVLDVHQCETMHGAYDLSVALTESINEAYNVVYGIKRILPLKVSIHRAIASRLYFLAKTKGLECNLSVFINFISDAYDTQLEYLSCFPELLPWIEPERELYRNRMDDWVQLRTSLIQAFGNFADPAVRALFSEQVAASSADGKAHDDQERHITEKPRLHRFEFIDNTDYSRFIKVFVCCMDNWYYSNGLCLCVRRISRPASVSKKDCNQAASRTVNRPAPKREESLAYKQLKEKLQSKDVRTISSSGIRYQHTFDSAAYMIALSTPRSANSGIKLARRM